MNVRTRLLTALAGLLLALPSAAMTQPAGAAAPPTGAAALAWQRYDTGFAQASASRKPIMVQVYADWCRECHRLQAAIEADAGLSKRLRQDFVLVRLNLGSDAQVRFQGQLLSEKQLALRLQATWPPMLLFYAADGRLIGRRFGPASPAELDAMLSHVLAKVRG